MAAVNTTPPPPSGYDFSPQEKPRACKSCRTRKIKCDGRTPICATCLAHSRGCEYDPNGPRRRSRVVGSRRDRQAHTKAAREQRVQPEETSNDERHRNSPYSSRPTPPTSARSSSFPLPRGEARSRSPEVDVSQHVALGRSGNLEIRGPTNTLYESPTFSAGPAPNSKQSNTASTTGSNRMAFGGYSQAAHIGRDSSARAPSSTEGHPYASEILTSHAAIERQKEIQYRSELLARGEIEGVPAELALHLLDVHWSRHHFFLITYRPAFYRDMMTGGPLWSPLLFFAILAVSCRYSERQEVGGGDHAAHSGASFFARAKQLLMDDMETSSVPTAAALLLMGNALVSAGSVDRGWLYTGMGIRMIINLGLHVEAGKLSAARDQRTVEEIETTRRLFWGAYVSEKLQSLYLGRPIFLRKMDCHVPKRFLDIYEEDEIWAPMPPPEGLALPVMVTSSVTNFTYHCVLAEICEDIMSSFYPVKAVATTHESLRSARERIRQRLAAWIRDLPQRLIFIPWSDKSHLVPIHVVVLHTIYLSLVILSERPFVADGHLASPEQQENDQNNWAQCNIAAEKIAHMLRAYREAYTFRRVPYQICYATYVASTIFARNLTSVSADTLVDSLPLQKPAQSMNPSTSIQLLEVCLQGFREMKLVHPGTARMEERIRSLMERLGVNVMHRDMTDPAADLQLLDSEIAAPLGRDLYLDVTANDMSTTDMHIFDTDTSEMFWNFGAQEANEDILFGAMRSEWLRDAQ